MTTSFEPTSVSTVELAPSYTLPIVLVLAAIPVVFLSPLLGGGLAIAIASLQALFGLFLMFQAATLRLHFTAIALDIYRGSTLIRHFPYQEWQNWQIFWSAVPVLFYFKEVKSIHFLPILFDPKTLKTCLEQRCPK